MISKIIHYCWLSNDAVPESLMQCMESWKRKLPDYEFVLWNFERFPRGKSKWVDEAFDNRKYAFAADFIRLYALYNYGGIYLDMDVEVLKSFDPLLELKSFMCWQNEMPGLEVAAMGSEKGAPWIKMCLDRYENRSFVKENGTFDMKVLPCVVEDVLRENAVSLPSVNSIIDAKEKEKNGLPVFPFDFFSPKSYKTGKISITQNTYCVHHFAGSWYVAPAYVVLESKLWNFFGMKNLNVLGKLYWKILMPVKKLFGKGNR